MPGGPEAEDRLHKFVIASSSLAGSHCLLQHLHFIFCQFLSIFGSQGYQGFENTPKIGFLRHPAALMRPPFPKWALKVT